MRTARGFIDGDDHGLALETAPHEMQDNILGDLFKPVITGDQVVFARELPFQLAFLGFIQFGLFQQASPYPRSGSDW